MTTATVSHRCCGLITTSARPPCKTLAQSEIFLEAGIASLKHFPYVASSDFHKPRHLYSWKTLLRCDKNWPAIRDALRRNVDVALTLFRDGSWTDSDAHTTTIRPSSPAKPDVVTAT